MPTPTDIQRIAVRIDSSNPLHHLWNNNGTWWCHLTVHRSDHTKRRVRISLKTANPDDACRRRDALFSRLATAQYPIQQSPQNHHQTNQ